MTMTFNDPILLAAALVVGAAAACVFGEYRVRRARRLTHDLRTPLNAIIGFSDMMRRQTVGPMPAVYCDYAQSIHDSAVDLLRVTERLTHVQPMSDEHFR